MTKYLACETTAVECIIYERHNTPNRVVIKSGDLTPTQIKAIAYQLLAMVET